eukprot:CAMPEP_0196720792 /NCGR_PEP_ID=MMETSP1091-20130531/3504_1 /TAXON_ID=302021 /ORGANISM="Rhodomonas sp., Strain CCMP768" /LENGTH=304 /DNA_ID=CAMNT_0042062117 /DNA_START=38 /DNA_END=949 /DNA_ORIENTATION=+
MAFSLSSERKRTLAVFAGLLFCLKLTTFSHSSLRAVMRSSSKPELAQMDDERTTDSRLQSFADGPRIVPHLSPISTCCHERCMGVRSGDYLCACCTEPPSDSTNAAHSPEGKDSETQQPSQGHAQVVHHEASHHSSSGHVPSAAVEEQRQWHQKHQHHHRQDEDAQQDLTRYAHPSSVQAQPLHLPEGSAQARPVDAVVQRVMAQKKNSVPTAPHSSHRHTHDAQSRTGAAQTTQQQKPKAQNRNRDETSFDGKRGDAKISASDDSFQGAQFVEDARKREKEAGLDEDSMEQTRGGRLDREKTW